MNLDSIVLIITCFLGNVSPSDDVSVYLDSLTQRRSEYVNKLEKKAKKLACSKKETEDYDAFFIYYLNFERPPAKAYFTSRDVLFQNLRITQSKGSKFPANRALLYDKKREVKFSFSNMIGYCTGAAKSFDELVMDYAFENNAPYAFQIMDGNISIYFLIVNDELKVIDLRDGILDVTDLEDFTQCCWSSLFP